MGPSALHPGGYIAAVGRELEEIEMATLCPLATNEQSREHEEARSPCPSQSNSLEPRSRDQLIPVTPWPVVPLAAERAGPTASAGGVRADSARDRRRVRGTLRNGVGGLAWELRGHCGKAPQASASELSAKSRFVQHFPQADFWPIWLWVAQLPSGP